MEAERSTERSIINYQLAERHMSEDCNIYEKKGVKTKKLESIISFSEKY
jgi:hypothetical protein